MHHNQSMADQLVKLSTALSKLLAAEKERTLAYGDKDRYNAAIARLEVAEQTASNILNEYQTSP